MAGNKATDTEKEQMRDLIKQGYSVGEVQQRFPSIDGRVISGISVRIKSNALVPSGGGPIGPLPSDPRPPPPGASPNPLDQGVKTAQQDSAERTGFTPQAQTIHNPQGLVPSYREYFVIKKLDGSDSGIIKTEQPPFGIVELYDRYLPGDYEVQHYRDGRLFATYRERIATKPGTISGITSEAKRPQEQTADVFLKAMDVYHKLSGERKGEEAAARREDAHVQVARETAKAQVETAATVGLIELVKETSRQKPDPNGPAIDRIFTMMQSGQKDSDSRHSNEIEVIREKAKADIALERERIKADSERAKQDSLERDRNQQAFIAKMDEISTMRQALWKESYDKMIEGIKDMQGSMSEEFDKKKEWLDSYAEIQKLHTDEVIKLKREFGSGGESLKMAEIVRDGIVGAVDRIGHRVDTLAAAGVFGKPAIKTGITQAEPAAAAAKPEEKSMPTKDAMSAASKEPWFQELQDEIARTVKKRKGGMVLHGSMLGQTFLDRMNENVKLRTYFHFLCSREWSEIMSDAADGIKPEHKEIFASEEAQKWFTEFQSFLVQSWNSSVGIK